MKKNTNNSIEVYGLSALLMIFGGIFISWFLESNSHTIIGVIVDVVLLFMVMVTISGSIYALVYGIVAQVKYLHKNIKD